MNLKLAKRIRQGMREMAQVTTGGAIRGKWPDDYEGEIQRKGDGELWATQGKNEDGTVSYTPTRLGIRLKQMTARQVYLRAKRNLRG